MHLTPTRLLLAMSAAGLSTQAGAATIFDADFDASTAVAGSVTANADAANLNAGTATGSWTTTGSANPGAIIANAGGTDNAFVFDQNVSGATSNRARGVFSSAVDLDAGEGIEFSIGFYAARQANGTREVRLSLDDASNAKAYVVMFDEDQTKNFDWLNTANQRNGGGANGNGGGGLGASAGPNTGFNNPDVDEHLSQNSGSLAVLTITIPGALDNTTVAGSTGALATIDWDGNGLIEAADGDVENVAFGPRSAGVVDLASFELFYGGSGTRGAWIDNISARSLPAVPEPGSLVLIALGSVAVGFCRRRG